MMLSEPQLPVPLLALLMFMLSAHWFMRVVGAAPLMVIGAVFGVLQAAMGLEILVSGLLRSRLFGRGALRQVEQVGGAQSAVDFRWLGRKSEAQFEQDGHIGRHDWP